MTGGILCSSQSDVYLLLPRLKPTRSTTETYCWCRSYCLKYYWRVRRVRLPSRQCTGTSCSWHSRDSVPWVVPFVKPHIWPAKTPDLNSADYHVWRMRSVHTKWTRCGQCGGWCDWWQKSGRVCPRRRRPLLAVTVMRINWNSSFMQHNDRLFAKPFTFLGGTI